MSDVFGCLNEIGTETPMDQSAERCLVRRTTSPRSKKSREGLTNLARRGRHAIKRGLGFRGEELGGVQVGGGADTCALKVWMTRVSRRRLVALPPSIHLSIDRASDAPRSEIEEAEG